MELAMKKKSLEDSVRGHSGGVIESEKEVEVKGESPLIKVVQNFEKFLGREIPNDIPLELDEEYFEGIPYILSSNELNAFLQLTPYLIGHENYERHLGYPLIVNVIGNVGSNFGWGTEKCRINFEGNANDAFCASVQNSEIYAQGNIGYSAFMEMKDSIVRIEADFQILGYNIENCIFKTANEDLLKKILDPKPGLVAGGNNGVVYIKPDGTEELVRRV